MNKKNLKIVSKVALLMVIFGFFQPVACNQNGFELAKTFMGYEKISCTIAGIGLYLILFAAAFSIIYTAYLLLTKKDICSSKADIVDFCSLFISIGGGLAAFLVNKDSFSSDYMQRGFWIVLIGWIISLAFLLLAKQKE